MTSSNPPPTVPAIALPSPSPQPSQSSRQPAAPQKWPTTIWTLLKLFPLPVRPALFCSGHSSLPFRFTFQCLLLWEALPGAPRPAPLPQKPCTHKKQNKNLAINKVWGCLCGTKVWACSCGSAQRGSAKAGTKPDFLLGDCKASLQKDHQSPSLANVLMVGEHLGPKRLSYPAPFS